MTSLTAALISVIGIVAAVLAAPTTYDQRQDGDLNVAAKLENILILIDVPSKTSNINVDESELASYLSLLGDRVNTSPVSQYDVAAETTNTDSIDDEEPSSGEEESAQAQKPSEEKIKSEEKVPKGRNLWGQLEDVVDNRQGGSLKKELSWDTSRSNDHNEVGLVPNRHLTLLGPGIEDCGPERHRNSYGICASLPSK